MEELMNTIMDVKLSFVGEKVPLSERSQKAIDLRLISVMGVWMRINPMGKRYLRRPKLMREERDKKNII